MLIKSSYNRPCYVGLRNNVSTPLLRTTLNAWPEGTPDFVDHSVIKDYIQNTSKKTGVDSVTRWGVRVVDLQKEGAAWKVIWLVIHGHTGNGDVEELSEVSDLSKHLDVNSDFSHEYSISML